MAKKATSSKKDGNGKSEGGRASSDAKPSRAVAVRRDSEDEEESSSGSGGAGEAFAKLLQSPFVADLLAVAATAALAALAEHGFSSRGASGGADGRRASRAVKAAGKAAAAAIGRRLANEIDEVKAAARRAKGGAEA